MKHRGNTEMHFILNSLLTFYSDAPHLLLYLFASIYLYASSVNIPYHTHHYKGCCFIKKNVMVSDHISLPPSQLDKPSSISSFLICFLL